MIGFMDQTGGELGPAARRLRQTELLSVELVAHSAGIPQQRLERIESGEVEGIRVREAMALAAALGTDLPGLLREAGLQP